jgi:predicted MPP superfamily phosphohydrolase
MSNNLLQSKQIVGRKFKSILIISDQHHPYQHKDLVPFLSAVKEKYKPDLVVNIGDEVDFHAASFHESEPDLYSAGYELKKAIESLHPLYKMFPNMMILDSNHGSLVMRKAKFAGLPSEVIKTPRDILKAPKGWEWCRELTANTELGRVFFHHGKTSVAGKLSKNMAMNVVQGHFHSRFAIDYWGSPVGLFWDMNVGCLVDDTSLAMAYNKVTIQRPVIGIGVIINGRPQLIPMHLSKIGRWTGRL